MSSPNQPHQSPSHQPRVESTVEENIWSLDRQLPAVQQQQQFQHQQFVEHQQPLPQQFTPHQQNQQVHLESHHQLLTLSQELHQQRELAQLQSNLIREQQLAINQHQASIEA
ncbi:hypothetical protein BDC45DRAFT_538014 [Circinella umbellata]|nr:hypothetical protein BDC45DRAFT_538014 [Circinella umbellata]